MPMPIQNAEEFDKVVNVSWYTPDRPAHEMTFPTVFPFSQMYPLCCIDIRNFLNQFYFFSAQEDNVPSPLSQKIDSQLLTSLDDLLTTKVCASLVSKLSSQYLGQIVQILINLSHFTTACHELENPACQCTFVLVLYYPEWQYFQHHRPSNLSESHDLNSAYIRKPQKTAFSNSSTAKSRT